MALAYVRHFQAQLAKSEQTQNTPLVVRGIAGSDRPSRTDIEKQVRERPGYKERPDTELALAQADQRLINPLAACGKLNVYLQQIHALRDDREIKRLSGSAMRSGGNYPFVILYISMPALSADGKTAALDIHQAYAPLAGGSSSVIMEKSGDGSWIVKEESQTSIS